MAENENKEECMIRIEHLKKKFLEARTTLTDVTTEIHRGDIIAVIGPSGTGKSTLLRCINRLEKPTEGKITILGTEVTDDEASLNLIRQKMGMVFQSFYLFDNLTVLENIIAAPMDLKKVPRTQAVEKAVKLLKQVGLEGREESFPFELSGGQKQRAAIARTLAMDPEIILFDEPTSALDPALIDEVQKVISDLAASGKTMMIVTHEMNFAKKISNRVFFMCDGGIYEDGTPEQIFDHPQKPKTIEFMMRDRTLKLDIDLHSFRIKQIVREIQQFLIKNDVSTKMILRIQILFEELVTALLAACGPETEKLFLTLAAGNSIQMAFRYAGAPVDPLNYMDEIASRLVNSVAECSHTYADGENEIICIIRKR